MTCPVNVRRVASILKCWIAWLEQLSLKSHRFNLVLTVIVHFYESISLDSHWAFVKVGMLCYLSVFYLLELNDLFELIFILYSKDVGTLSYVQWAKTWKQGREVYFVWSLTTCLTSWDSGAALWHMGVYSEHLFRFLTRMAVVMAHAAWHFPGITQRGGGSLWRCLDGNRIQNDSRAMLATPCRHLCHVTTVAHTHWKIILIQIPGRGAGWGGIFNSNQEGWGDFPSVNLWELTPELTLHVSRGHRCCAFLGMLYGDSNLKFKMKNWGLVDG